jgi:ABC-2 type transport system permease protein
MNRIKAIFKREFASYFRSPMGFVLFAIFLALGGMFFTYGILNSYISMGSEISFLQSFFFVIIPLLTMRSFSEDRRNGTEVLLFTSPASTLEIVAAKYLAALAMFSLMVSGTLIHVLITSLYNGLIGIEVLGAYIGFFFLGATYIAIGVFASALTENQIIAAVISFIIILAMGLLDFLSSTIGTFVSSLLSKINFFSLLTDLQIDKVGSAVTSGLNFLNPTTRINNYLQGIFEVTPLLFFLSIIAAFLFLTNRIIEKRRWSQR